MVKTCLKELLELEILQMLLTEILSVCGICSEARNGYLEETSYVMVGIPQM
jgi:hypothetical protein